MKSDCVSEWLGGLLTFFFSVVLQVVVSSYEAASTIIIEFDMDNSIFGLPREFVVASAGKHEEAFC